MGFRRGSSPPSGASASSPRRIGLVAEQGYPATSLEAIAKAAGVSHQTFYDHFADKEELALAIFDYATGRMCSGLAEAWDAEPGSWQAKLRATLLALCEALAAEPEPARVWLIESRGAGPVALERYEAELQRLAVRLRSLRALAGPPASGLPESTEEILAGGLARIVGKRLTGDPKRLRERLIEAVSTAVEFVLLPYRAVRPGG
jgi:AcrR family transcriptional regulator